MKKIVVAIDGLSSCGKSTMAKELAQYAGYIYVDTGAMYRALALFGIRNGWITPDAINGEALEKQLDRVHITLKNMDKGLQHVYLGDEDVTADIRTLAVGDAASRVSTLKFVRRELVRQQQLMGREKGVVMDGRDIGTVVFPQAELKVFVTATPEVRAMRRFEELKAKGQTTDFQTVLADVCARDERDSRREESPLRQADDAWLLDTSNLTREQQRTILFDKFDARLQAFL
ncbi:MAG: (d)CMP kinase [Prevotellaceae bacterium]|jgi:cytidylate kinase|nr:(d)CMP kinase [Prevotellaceae bacterium]